MDIRQISVFLENKKGRLADVTNVLAKQGINIRALFLADTQDFGVLRMIVNDAGKTLQILKDNNFVAQETSVVAVEVEDKPGGLNRILHLLDEKDINIEYMYAFVEKKADNAIVIFKIDEHEAAKKVLLENKIGLLTTDVLEKL
ncbi:MAG: ACT domain-containing protein [Spirochaetales bacterium]|nr:ACT domain-containing protein [Spirochaetales bacterium]